MKNIKIEIGCGDDGEHEINRVVEGGDWDWEWCDIHEVDEALLLKQEAAKEAYRKARGDYFEACAEVAKVAKLVRKGQ